MLHTVSGELESSHACIRTGVLGGGGGFLNCFGIEVAFQDIGVDLSNNAISTFL